MTDMLRREGGPRPIFHFWYMIAIAKCDVLVFEKYLFIFELCHFQNPDFFIFQYKNWPKNWFFRKLGKVFFLSSHSLFIAALWNFKIIYLKTIKNNSSEQNFDFCIFAPLGAEKQLFWSKWVKETAIKSLKCKKIKFCSKEIFLKHFLHLVLKFH